MRKSHTAICLLFAATVTAQEIATPTETIIPTAEQIDFLGITNADKLSAATKRALRWPDLGNQWFIQFQTQELKGDLAFEEGVCRRDPSAMIKEDGKYYVWYTRGVGETQGFGGNVQKDKVFPWDRCDIWYATSTDGWTWQEQGLAVPRGEPGSHDDRSVFTTEIMKHDGMYYLCYQTVKSPYNVRVKNQIGLAWSHSPDGPWTKSKEPILSPADNRVWDGEEQNRFRVKKKGDFDSHKVHDPCILPFKGKFYLYYKGEMGGSPPVRAQGLAIAEDPLGPFQKHPLNPVINSGHETSLFPFKTGLAALVSRYGLEHNTIQDSPDGVNFDIAAITGLMPIAPGAHVPDAFTGTKDGRGITWGLCHFRNIKREEGKSHSMLARFDCDLSLDVHDIEMKETDIFNDPEINFKFGLSEAQRKRIEASAMNGGK